MKISIIIPALNEGSNIANLLSSLQPLRSVGHEIIVVDGGSTDDTLAVSQPLCDRLISAPRGRAIQMNAGARDAQGEIFWFLHADSQLSAETIRALPPLLDQDGWGRLDVQLSGKKHAYRIIGRMMNLRSRLTGVVTGDQAIFVGRRLFQDVDGYPVIPLMEDIALSKKLRKERWPLALRQRVITSSRRWEEKGLLRTVFLMWQLRLQYFMGANPDQLVNKYYG